MADSEKYKTMDIVTIIVFIAAWILCGGLAGFMVYLTPDFTKGHVIAAVVFSWLIAMIIACLVHFIRNPIKFKDEQAEKMVRDAGADDKKVDDISIDNAPAEEQTAE